MKTKRCPAYTITFPFALVMRSEWDRMHYRNRKNYMRMLALHIATSVSPPEKPIEHCTIAVTRWSPRLPDHDNACGGLKPLLDVLCVTGAPNKNGHCIHPCGLGFIRDDDQRCIVRPVEFRTEIGSPRTVVEISIAAANAIKPRG